MKKRWKEIDVLYTIGIILVLIGHSHSSDWSTFRGTILEKAILFIYTFHMPLFFFISGFLFQNSRSLQDRGYGTWIRDKALRLLTPYLFWSLIAVIPKYYVENRSFVGVGKAILDVFINPRASAWGHFWFLPVLFLTYAIFGAAKKQIEGRKRIAAVLVVTAIIYFLPIKTNILGLSDLHTSLFFFSVGMAANLFLTEKKPKIPRWGGILLIITVMVGCALLTSQAYTNSTVGMLVALLMISACWAGAKLIEVKGWISSHNFTIYIFSWFFQAVMMALCGRLGFNWIVTFFAMFGAGLIGPVIVIFIYEKMTFLHKNRIKLVLGMRG